MPYLDLAFGALDPDFADLVSVVRRAENVGSNGYDAPISTTYANVVATVIPGGKSLKRDDAAQHAPAEIDVIMPIQQVNVAGGSLRLQGVAEGFQPDLVVWKGDSYVVRDVNDYTRLGMGWVEARCESYDSEDQPD